MSAKPVRIPFLGQLAKIEPFDVQSQDAVLGEVDTPLLLVLNGLPRRAHVPVHIQNRGDLPV